MTPMQLATHYAGVMMYVGLCLSHVALFALLSLGLDATARNDAALRQWFDVPVLSDAFITMSGVSSA